MWNAHRASATIESHWMSIHRRDCVGGWEDAIGLNRQSFDKANLCSQDIQEVRKKKFFLQLVSHKIMQSYKMSKQLLILCCKRG